MPPRDAGGGRVLRLWSRVRTACLRVWRCALRATRFYRPSALSSKASCSACGEVFTASLPPDVRQEKQLSGARWPRWGRQYLGLPFHRIRRVEALLGAPLSDATQWELIETVGDSGYVVFRHLECLAAQGELIVQDDTSVRILSLLKENQGLKRGPKPWGCRGA